MAQQNTDDDYYQLTYVGSDKFEASVRQRIRLRVNCWYPGEVPGSCASAVRVKSIQIFRVYEHLHGVPSHGEWVASDFSTQVYRGQMAGTASPHLSSVRGRLTPNDAWGKDYTAGVIMPDYSTMYEFSWVFTPKGLMKWVDHCRGYEAGATEVSRKIRITFEQVSRSGQDIALVDRLEKVVDLSIFLRVQKSLFRKRVTMDTSEGIRARNLEARDRES
ncbi:hypothetical protein NLU13_2455 [Sarocladium strictum]|uniref:Uncharacterized protein n=1 Tax=Sarocladium strictum TaxID=5046 RepID=A0AA39GT35_SARSR|nr:hypothetical protein NLU13_2455 [Sarocladium strictum]